MNTKLLKLAALLMALCVTLAGCNLIAVDPVMQIAEDRASLEQTYQTVLAEYDDPNKFDVQRYKGLGEMDPDQLWETTMEPATRTLLQVSIDDAAEAERVVSDLMGDQVEPRKEFIQKHARDVRFLDI